jgi:hypothetical protein
LDKVRHHNCNYNDKQLQKHPKINNNAAINRASLYPEIVNCAFFSKASLKFQGRIQMENDFPGEA